MYLLNLVVYHQTLMRSSYLKQQHEYRTSIGSGGGLKSSPFVAKRPMTTTQEDEVDEIAATEPTDDACVSSKPTVKLAQAPDVKKKKIRFQLRGSKKALQTLKTELDMVCRTALKELS